MIVAEMEKAEILMKVTEQLEKARQRCTAYYVAHRDDEAQTCRDREYYVARRDEIRARVRLYRGRGGDRET